MKNCLTCSWLKSDCIDPKGCKNWKKELKMAQKKHHKKLAKKNVKNQQQTLF